MAGPESISPDAAADTQQIVSPAAMASRVGVAGFPVESPQERMQRAALAVNLLDQSAQEDPALGATPEHQTERARAAAIAQGVPPLKTYGPGSVIASPATPASSAPSATPTWDEVLRLPEMRGLSGDQLESARGQYFLDVVAPMVATADLPAAREAFDSDTKPGPFHRAVHAISDAVNDLSVRNAVAWARRGVGFEDRSQALRPQEQTPKRFGVDLSGESLDQLERSYRQGVQGIRATDLTATRGVLNLFDRIDGGEKIPLIDSLPANADPLRVPLSKRAPDPYRLMARDYQDASPEVRAQMRGRLESLHHEDITSIVNHAKEMVGLYQNPKAAEAIKAADNYQFRQAWKAFSDDPGGIMKEMTLSNAAQVAPVVAGGAAGIAFRGGMPAFLAGVATGSFPVDYAMSVNEYLNDKGIDLTSYKAVDAAMRDKSFMADLQRYAALHATGVTVGDVVAGKLMSPVKGTLVKAATAAAGNVVKGVAGEAGGEALGELLAEGTIHPGQVIAEGLAAGPMAVAGSAAATVTAPKEAAQPARPAPATAPDTGPVDAAEVLGAPLAAAAQPEPKARAAGAVAGDGGVGEIFSPAGGAAASAEAPKPPEFVQGKTTNFATERGAKLEGQYAVADVGALVTSHDAGLNVNKAYPAELQPRDRSRDASEVQIARIAQNLQADFLGESPQASQGAPIVGDDGVVESGNARTIALQRAYKAGQAEGYRDWLLKNADAFGLDPAKLSQVKQPMLVRVRTTPVNRAEFARQANESSIAQLSPLETARADAARLKSIEDLKTGENGEIQIGDNMAFIRRFAGMLPVTEQSALVTGSGELSQAGITRVRNAILAKAYGGGDTLMRMVESPDDNIRNISNALVRAAPRVAKAREGFAEGALHKLDITEDLLKAVEWMSKLRADKRDVEQWLAQISFFEADASPEFKTLMRFLDEQSRSPRRIAEFIEHYITSVEAAGSPNQGSMFGDQVPDKSAIIENAKKGLTREQGAELVHQGDVPAAAPASGAAQGDQGAGARAAPGASGAEEADGAAAGEKSGGGRDRADAVDDLKEKERADAARKGEQPKGDQPQHRGDGGGGASAEAGGGRRAEQREARDAKPAQGEVQRRGGGADGSSVDQAAHEAATSPKNDKLEPTPAQLKAGNFEKGHTKLGGNEISIEHPAGSRRRPDWPALKHHYGYFLGTVGRDKDHVDLFVKPGTPENWKGTYFVVNQAKADGGFDEHKVMAGFDDEASAKAAYLSNYPAGMEKRVMSIAPLDSEAFDAWAFDKTNNGPKGGELKVEARKAAPAFSRVPEKPFADAVRDMVTGKSDPRDTLTVLNTPPPVLQALGVKPHKLVLGGSTISKMLYDHGLSMPVVQRLPALIADPVLVFESDTVPGDFVIVTTEKVLGLPLVVTLRPDGDVNRQVVNVITSGYPRNKPNEAFNRWIKGDLLAYEDQAKRPAWQRSLGLQLPGKMPTRGAGKKLLSQADLVKKLGGGGTTKGPESPAFMRGDIPHPAYDLSEDGPRLVAGDVGIVQPSKWETRAGMTMYEHTIISGGKPIGVVTLGWIDDKAVFLPNIRLYLKDRKQGVGERVIRALVEHNGAGVELTVGYIESAARPFWSKMGVRIEDTDEGTFGQISLESYRNARPVEEGGAAQRGGGEEGSQPQAGRAREGEGSRGALRRGEVGSAAAGVSRVQAEAAAITKAWRNAPAVEVVGNPKDLPFEAPQDAHGAFWKGKVYLVASNLPDAARTQLTVFHEALGHYGLRRFFGNELDQVLRDIAVKNRNVRAAAERWKAENEKPADWTDTDYRLQAIEEALAKVAESGRAITGLGKLLAKVQAWLRAHGLEAVADWLEGMSDAEALSALASARESVVGEGKAEPHILEGELAARFSTPASPFYSELARSVAKVKVQTAPAEQWRSIIKGLPGVKADEVEWSGVLDWLAMQGKRVARDDVLGFLRENGVRVEETMLGEDVKEAPSRTSEIDQLKVELDAMGYDVINDELEDEFGLRRRSDRSVYSDLQGMQDSEHFAGPLDDLPPDVGQKFARLASLLEQEHHDVATVGETKYSSYTLPGGDNYRELLLTLPQAHGQKLFDQSKVEIKRDIRSQTQGSTTIVYDGKHLATYGDDPQLQPGGKYEQRPESHWMAVAKRVFESGDQRNSISSKSGAFRSGHFDELNILAHIRLDDRVDTEGKKVLFVEEIQSDWAQRGKRQGFVRSTTGWSAKRIADHPSGNGGKYVVYDANGKVVETHNGGGAAYDWWGAQTERDAIEKAGSISKIPAAPFVQKTEAWVALSLKRVIAYAAAHGYDRVAWTTGEQQVERYQLEKYIESVTAQRDRQHKDSWNLTVHPKRGTSHRTQHLDNVVTQSLPDYVGKDLAEKIVRDGGGFYSGLDLRIGGDGMRAFYDQIVPQLANALLKKFGGARVQGIPMSLTGEYEIRAVRDEETWTLEEKHPKHGWQIIDPDTQFSTKAEAEKHIDRLRNVREQPGFDITPALRATARDGLPMFSRAPAGAAPRRRESLFNAVTRIPVQALRIDKLTSATYDYLLEKIGGLVPETVKAGMGHDYGIPEAVSDRRAQMFAHQRSQLRDVQGVLGKLLNLTRAESRVAYEWMNQRDGGELLQQLPEESRAVLQGVKEKIDTLSREAVRLGQLSADAYDRSRLAYLHRSYQKYELEATKQDQAARSRAVRVLGDQYKGRGMVDAVDTAKLKNTAPEWWGRKLQEKKGDKGLKGQMFIRLERREKRGEGVGTLPGVEAAEQRGRLRELVYLPAGEAVPARYEGWQRDAGEWQVRDVQGAKVVLWRDFTKAERQKMGEVDEVRFAVAKTLQQMIHDVESGKYLEWLANNHSRDEERLPRGEKIADASESLFRTFGKEEWVKVPEATIPGTKVAKYGKLAGLYLPGPIWNDVRQVVNHRYAPLGQTYATLLKAWKISKTALSPAVHLNNVMANVIMADWHDVLARDLTKAMRVMVNADEAENKALLEAFEDNGGSEGMYVLSELQREQLKPLIAELQKEVNRADSAGMVNAAGVLQAMMSGKWREALDAAAGGAAARGAKAAANLMIDLYQAEDTVFRLAAFIKAKADGKSDAEAGKVARTSFLDYSINAPWVQVMRSTALPFVSFLYRAAPMLLETYARKPWKALKLWMVLGGLNALGYLMSGGDEDKERKLQPKEKRGKIFGFLGPKLIRMPWNAKDGSPVFLDIRRFIPAGDIFDLEQTHAALPWLPGAVPGGPLALAIELAANRSQFTGKSITNESDTAREIAGKVFDHIFKSVAPNLPFVPGTYSFEAIANAGKGRTDVFGREQSLPQAIASSVGVKVAAYPADVAKSAIQAEYNQQKGEIEKEIARLGRELHRKGMTRDEFNDKMNYQREKLKKLASETRERTR